MLAANYFLMVLGLIPTSFASLQLTIFSSTFSSSTNTDQPSVFPTKKEKEISHQPTSTIFSSSSTNTVQPSVTPTGSVIQNTEQPTSAPTSTTKENNSQQTSYIVTTPTHQPTSSPTNVVEPTLLVGRDYWWVVIAHIQLYGDIASSTFTEFSNISRYPQVIKNVMSSILSDTLPLAHQDDIVAIDTRFLDGGTTHEWIMVNNNQSTNNNSVVSKEVYYMNTNVKIWTNSIASGQDILLSFETIQQEPHRFINPLQAAGLTLINDIHIENADLIETSEPPDNINSPQPLSPSRVFLIIVGTVVGFFVGACLLGYLVSFCRRHPHPMELGREIRDRYLYPVWALLVGFVQSWKQLASEVASECCGNGGSSVRVRPSHQQECTTDDDLSPSSTHPLHNGMMELEAPGSSRTSLVRFKNELKDGGIDVEEEDTNNLMSSGKVSLHRSTIQHNHTRANPHHRNSFNQTNNKNNNNDEEDMDSFESISVSFYRSACSMYGHITSPPVVTSSPPIITSSLPIIKSSSSSGVAIVPSSSSPSPTTSTGGHMPTPTPAQHSNAQSTMPLTHHQTSQPMCTSPASPSSPGT